MEHTKSPAQVVFIVGAPRSGTTLLGDILDCHPDICHFYEPHFVIDRYFKDYPSDIRHETDATSEIVNYVRSHFYSYSEFRQCSIVVDKTPSNSLRIPFLRRIFPQAKFIHMLRDGRDSILSMHKEWIKREKLINNPKRIYEIFSVLKDFLDQHPLLRHKARALWFEMAPLSEVIHGRKGLFWRTRRWNGRFGYGPQIEGWEALMGKVSTIEFIAHQWKACVQSVYESQQAMQPNQSLTITYEQLVRNPEDQLHRAFNFLRVSSEIGNILRSMPMLYESSIGKWENEFSASDKFKIGSIIGSLLIDLGYASTDQWFRHSN